MNTRASSAEADLLCPGRHLAQSHLPEVHSGDSDFGNRIHAALKTDNPDGLTHEEFSMFESCKEIRDKIIHQIFGDAQITVIKEELFWTQLQLNGVIFQHDGHPDFVAIAKELALIIDYKSLAGSHPVSSKNLQLRDYVCMVKGKNPTVTKVAVAVIQPLVTHDPEITLYTGEDFQRATQEMFQRIVNSQNLTSPRIAGQVQCRFCKAKTQCPEYNQWIASQLPVPLDLFKSAMVQWTPEQRTMAAEILAPCRKALDDIEEFLKTQEVPGWYLKPGRKMTTVTDIQTVFDRFMALGGTNEMFLRSINVIQGRLTDELGDVLGLKGKKLADEFKKLTNDCISTKQAAGSLARKT